MTATVRTTRGSVRAALSNGVFAFKGIPYAAAPTGTRRFRPPMPADSWTSVRDATEAGPIAPQVPLPGALGSLTSLGPMSDDHLNLNVWTPDPANEGLPVLVWIHGGAFYSGSSSEDLFDGTSFAQHGVACVTINYRLGANGFCYLDEHFPHLGGTGNLGLLDQVAALQWVQENAAAFGGDPARVTIAGESAGGMSVLALMAMPSARGLSARPSCRAHRSSPSARRRQG